MSMHSPTLVPMFGGWDMDSQNGEQQAFTLIFDKIHADKTMKGVNPNDPAFLATVLANSTASGGAPPSHGRDHRQPPSHHQSSGSPQISSPKPSMNTKTHSPAHVPRFGDWDVDAQSGEQQAFTLIFDNIRSDKSMEGVNPNDPAFFATVLANSTASGVTPTSHDRDHHDPPSHRQSSGSPQISSSKLLTNTKTHSPAHVPRFGDWDVDAQSGEQQAFTLFFDNARLDKGMKGVNPNDPAFLATFLGNSTASGVHASSHDPHHHEPPSQNEAGLLQTSSTKPFANSKFVTTPKFGDWDLNNQKEYTYMFDDLKEEKQNHHRSAKRTENRAKYNGDPITKHKTNSSVVNWRLCFGRNRAVRD